MKNRVTGIGGIFFRVADPKASTAWYVQHLGLTPEAWGGSVFNWRSFDNPEQKATTVWSPFPRDTAYFGDSGQQYMINYRVENLDELLTQLQAEGVWIDEKRENSDYGRFAWIKDGDGNRIELWEPPKNDSDCS
ncbi:MAG: VOC family protein [Betaproteobacteria bacterium]|nr:VOC family protein [Betaproteobacteria bacterium]